MYDLAHGDNKKVIIIFHAICRDAAFMMGIIVTVCGCVLMRCWSCASLIACATIK